MSAPWQQTEDVADGTPSETMVRINKANHIKRSLLYSLGVAKDSLVQQFDKGLYLVKCDQVTLVKLRKEYRSLMRMINYWPKKPISKSWRRDQSHTAIVHITAEDKEGSPLLLHEDDYVNLRVRLEKEIREHHNPEVRSCTICRTANYQVSKKKKNTNSALRTFYAEFSTQVEVKTIIDNCVIDATEWTNRAHQRCYLHIVQACAKEFAYESKPKTAAEVVNQNVVPQVVYQQNPQLVQLHNCFLQGRQGTVPPVAQSFLQLDATGASFVPQQSQAAHPRPVLPPSHQHHHPHHQQVGSDEDGPPPLLEDLPEF